MSTPIRIPISALRPHMSNEQGKALGLPDSGELELQLVSPGEWKLVSTPSSPKPPTPALHAKVLRLIQTHQAHELIEGRFEKLLSGEELLAFTELRNQGKVIVHKTNANYDKGIYRISNGEKVQSAPLLNTPNLQERPMDEYTLVGDGFQVLRTEGAAKAASFDLAERIRGGEVKGIKSFDGFYYLVENNLLSTQSARVIEAIRANKKIELPSLASQLHIPVILARIVIEFTKEEGSIIEKKKNVFAYVG